MTRKLNKREVFNDILNVERPEGWVHPELKGKEVFLINVRDNEDWESNLPSFIQGVRRGNVAYTTGGKEVVPDMKPLFGVLK